jgi:flagellar hook-basal body complex protein FliE
MSEFGMIDLYGRDTWSKLQESRLNKIENSQLEDIQKSDAGPSFKDTLESAIGETNETLMAADKAAMDFAAGKDVNLHDVLISMEKAEVSLKTLSAVRGKIVEAYQEIMRMQV